MKRRLASCPFDAESGSADKEPRTESRLEEFVQFDPAGFVKAFVPGAESKFVLLEALAEFAP